MVCSAALVAAIDPSPISGTQAAWVSRRRRRRPAPAGPAAPARAGAAAAAAAVPSALAAGGADRSRVAPTIDGPRGGGGAGVRADSRLCCTQLCGRPCVVCVLLSAAGGITT